MLAFLLSLLMSATFDVGSGQWFDENNVRVLWAPFPGMQTQATAAIESEVFVGGSKGPGKTDIVVAKATEQTDNGAYKGWVTRETGPQLSEIKRRMHALYPQMPERPAWNGDGHGKWTFPSGAEIILESIATVADAAKVQGKEPTCWFPDEVANIADEAVIDTVLAELRAPDPRLRTQMVGTGNPGKPGQAWVVRRFIKPCGTDGRTIVVKRVKLPNGMIGTVTRRFIPGTVLDNPIYANDPMYLARLMSLPEVLRKQLLFGDWFASAGLALDELDESKHLVKPFQVPDHWTRFGAFDYGYAHWWVWPYFAVNEDGRVVVVDTVRGRRQKPHQIAERVLSRLDVGHPNYLYTMADSYSFQSKKERDDNTPTIAELLIPHGLVLSQATGIDRKKGLTNLRYYTAWRGINPDGTDGLPALTWMDTPGNRWAFEQLQSMVTDPADPEDVLKVDANPETGEGGDDAYDATRVGMASRPPRAIGEFYRAPVGAFTATTLAHMVEQLYRDRPSLTPNGGSGTDPYTMFTGT